MPSEPLQIKITSVASGASLDLVAVTANDLQLSGDWETITMPADWPVATSASGYLTMTGTWTGYSTNVIPIPRACKYCNPTDVNAPASHNASDCQRATQYKP